MDRAAEFVRNVRTFIEANGLIARGDFVLAAISGGPDSVALATVLSDLRVELDKERPFELSLAHVNHGLRPEADAEEQFVRDMCGRLGLRLKSKRVDTRAFAASAKLSIEEAARELRYAFLDETVREGGHTKVALGHTLNDQAETVLMRLIRGAGVRGLSAMKALSRGIYIRPLLSSTRDDVNTFLAARGLSCVQDVSNVDRTFLRNRVRHELMPLLEESYNPSIVRALGSQASLLQEAEDFLGSVGREAYGKCAVAELAERIELELASLMAYHTCVQGYVLREAYFRLRGNLRDLAFLHVESMIRLMRSGQSGDSVDLPHGVVAMLEGNRLLLGVRDCLRASKSDPAEFRVKLEPGGLTVVPGASISVESCILKREELGAGPMSREREEVFFDLDELAPPLSFKGLKPGDRMRPFGMSGSRKVQDVLVDMKVPRSARPGLVALCDSREILWIVGLRRSSAGPVTEKTRSVLKVRLLSADPHEQDHRSRA